MPGNRRSARLAKPICERFIHKDGITALVIHVAMEFW